MRTKSFRFLLGILFIVLFVFIFTQEYLANKSQTPSGVSVRSSNFEDRFIQIHGANCIPNIDDYQIATLLDVIDGDSIRVVIDGVNFEVRYIGIDAPEYYSDDQKAAIEATEENKNLLGSLPLYLFKDSTDRDKYDRLLRYVIAGEKFVNLEMVRSGKAISKAYQPDTSCQAEFDKLSSP